MKIAVSWCSIYLNKPIRGVCIEYSDPKDIEESSGLPKGTLRFFNINDYNTNKYTLYSLSDEDIRFLESERKLAESVFGKNINHDRSFSFVSEFVCKTSLTLKHYMSAAENKVGEFTLSDIQNPNPYDVYRGIKFN